MLTNLLLAILLLVIGFGAYLLGCYSARRYVYANGFSEDVWQFLMFISYVASTILIMVSVVMFLMVIMPV